VQVCHVWVEFYLGYVDLENILILLMYQYLKNDFFLKKNEMQRS
jgi:hypothetical protein